MALARTQIRPPVEVAALPFFRSTEETAGTEDTARTAGTEQTAGTESDEKTENPEKTEPRARRLISDFWLVTNRC